MRAVRYDDYGDIDVLRVEEVPTPAPAAGQVLVEVKAASVNPGEAAIRKGLLADRWPSAFPSGQGSDLAGVITQIGSAVRDFEVGDEVLGYSYERSSQAQYVAVPTYQIVRRPAGVPWDQAGSVFIAGTAAYASVKAVSLGAGDVLVISGAAGGLGTVAVQLATLSNATVIGLASPEHHDWLRAHGAIPVAYGDGVLDRIRAAAPNPVTAWIDLYGDGYVEQALDLGVAEDRINTVIDFEAGQKYGVHTDGNAAADRPEVLAELAGLIDKGELTIPIAATFPLDQVQDAYRLLEQRHTLGKIVLHP